MPELIFYEKIVALDRTRHGKLRVKPALNHGFAARASAIPLVAEEYMAASCEYPIVFARTAHGKLLSLALTGARPNENLYVGGDGLWNGRYIPAFVRRYPFVCVATGSAQLTVCIDERFAGLNPTEGDALFREDGAVPAFMQGVFAMLIDYRRQSVRTAGLLKKLEDGDLLRDTELHAQTPDGRCATIKGAQVVDGDKFRRLAADPFQERFSPAEVGLVYAHLFSLAHVAELARRLPVATLRGTEPTGMTALAAI